MSLARLTRYVRPFVGAFAGARFSDVLSRGHNTAEAASSYAELHAQFGRASIKTPAD